MKNPLDHIVAGSLAGFAATVPMSAVMVGLHQQLPHHERYPLPPRQITEEAAEQVGVDDDLTEPQKEGLTVAAHFAYGAGMGAVYALSPLCNGKPTMASGVAFGLGVWAASYLGWLPALGSRTAATDEPGRRNALMIAAHVVWGGSLGLMTGQFLGHDRGR